MLFHPFIDFGELSEECFEEIDHLSHTCDVTRFTDGMHAEFWTSHINCPHTETLCLYGTDGRTAVRIVTNDEVLQRDLRIAAASNLLNDTTCQCGGGVALVAIDLQQGSFVQ